MKLIGAATYFPPIEENKTELDGIWSIDKPRGNSELFITDMAKIACDKVLEDAGLLAENIDMIISISVSPDHLVGVANVAAPRLCHPLQREIQASNAFVFDLLDADWATATDVAQGFCKNVGFRHVLIVRGELTAMSIIKDKTSGFAIGDGAGVLLYEYDEAHTTNQATYLDIKNVPVMKLEILEPDDLCKGIFKAEFNSTIGYENSQSIINQGSDFFSRNIKNSKYAISESWYPGHNLYPTRNGISYHSLGNEEYQHMGPFTFPYYAKELLDSEYKGEISAFFFNPFLMRYSHKNFII